MAHLPIFEPFPAQNLQQNVLPELLISRCYLIALRLICYWGLTNCRFALGGRLAWAALRQIALRGPLGDLSAAAHLLDDNLGLWGAILRELGGASGGGARFCGGSGAHRLKKELLQSSKLDLEILHLRWSELRRL